MSTTTVPYRMNTGTGVASRMVKVCVPQVAAAGPGVSTHRQPAIGASPRRPHEYRVKEGSGSRRMRAKARCAADWRDFPCSPAVWMPTGVATSGLLPTTEGREWRETPATFGTRGVHMQMASVVRDEVKEIFDRIDHDRDGRVSFDELRVWLAR